MSKHPYLPRLWIPSFSTLAVKDLTWGVCLVLACLTLVFPLGLLMRIYVFLATLCTSLCFQRLCLVCCYYIVFLKSCSNTPNQEMNGKQDVACAQTHTQKHTRCFIYLNNKYKRWFCPHKCHRHSTLLQEEWDITLCKQYKPHSVGKNFL